MSNEQVIPPHLGCANATGSLLNKRSGVPNLLNKYRGFLPSVLNLHFVLFKLGPPSKVIANKMAEAAAAIGVVASAITLLDFGKKVLARMDEFQSKAVDVPVSYRSIKTQLRILLHALEIAQEAAQSGSMSEAAKNALLEGVDDCTQDVKRLEDMIVKSLPNPSDTGFTRGRKAVVSVWNDEEVARVAKRIRGYTTTLSLFLVAASSSSKKQKSKFSIGLA